MAVVSMVEKQTTDMKLGVDFEEIDLSEQQNDQVNMQKFLHDKDIDLSDNGEMHVGYQRTQYTQEEVMEASDHDASDDTHVEQLESQSKKDVDGVYIQEQIEQSIHKADYDEIDVSRQYQQSPKRVVLQLQPQQEIDIQHQESIKVVPDIIAEGSISRRIYSYNQSLARSVARPFQAMAKMAHLKTRYHVVNMTWLLLILCLLPAAFALVWFVVIPMGDTYGERKDKMVWLLVVNPGTFCLLAFTLVTIFLSALDSKKPWRPFWTYAGILVATYVFQVLLPGLVVVFHHPFEALGLVAYAMTVAVVLIGLRITPNSWFHAEKEHYCMTWKVFRKICVVLQIYFGILMAYIILNSYIDSRYVGFITFALAIITFICKKVLLAFTDRYPLEVAMVISGLWLENLEDLFVTLAYPIIPSGISFAIVWLTKIGENVVFLVFQLNIWFKFRVWIKGKFKKDQQGRIEEDLDEDDRGHSNQHPGYRRRQTRFLIWKLTSQLSANCFFLIVIPALRYTHNKEYYPYSTGKPRIDANENDLAIDPLEGDEFRKAYLFALGSIFTVLISAFLIWRYMKWRHQEVLDQLSHRFRFLAVDDAYFGFVLTIFVSNVLLAVAAVAVPYRMFFF